MVISIKDLNISFLEKVMNSKGPYLFRIVSRSTDIVGSISETEKMLLLLRIRNVGNCIEYLKTCPDSVRDIFRYSDEGWLNWVQKSKLVKRRYTNGNL